MWLLLILAIVNTCALAANEVLSTAQDTTSLSLTIYNQNFAIVREQRKLSLARGSNDVRYQDVAAHIDPTSLSLKSSGKEKTIQVREQNYQYDLLNPSSILNKSVGKKVKFRKTKPGGDTETVEGTLLNPPYTVVSGLSGGPGQGAWQGLVLRLASGRLLLNPEGSAELEEMPAGLVSEPSLLWKLESNQSGPVSVDVAYIANRLTWKADYVAVIGKEEKTLDLTGWVTLDNKSGGSYAGAQLQLMAGNVRRVSDAATELLAAPAARSQGAEPQAAPFQEESFFEYHLYTLQHPTTIRDNELKQITLLAAPNAGVSRKLVYDVSANRPTYWPGEGDENGNVNVVLEIKNSKENNMGLPLPKGKIRVYKEDDRSQLQFLGEDLIDHTPKEETVRLKIGDSFDVKGERKRLEYKKTSSRSSEETVRVTIKNHKETAAQVSIIERFWGDWKIEKSSHRFDKPDAQTAEFPVDVAAEGETAVVYTVRQKW